MKSVLIKTSVYLLFLVSLAWPAAAAARAQQPPDIVKLQLDNLDRLEATASRSINVTLDGQLLRFAISFLRNDKPTEKTIKEMVSGLKGIYVKIFDFDKEGGYASADIDSVRTQLRAPGWSRMAEVKSKRATENIEVYSLQSAGQIQGMTVIMTSPRRLGVVHIAGFIDLEKLAQLRGKFGIPEFEFDMDDKKPAGGKP